MTGGELKALIDQAKPLVNAAIKIDEEKAKAAGELLLKIKQERPKGSWDQYVKMHFGIGQQWADQLISIFEGKTTRAEVREKTKKAVKRHRSKVAAKSPLRNGDFSSKPSTPSQPGHEPFETPEGLCDRFGRLCDDLVAACEHLTSYKNMPKHWGDRYGLPARRALDALNALAAKLEKPPLSADAQESAATVATSH
jgi:hypothetical protein